MRNLLVIAAMCFLAAPAVAAEARPATSYQFHLTVSRIAEGQRQTLVNPAVTVCEGQAASISIEDHGTTYTFDVMVGRQDGKLVASTKTKIVENQTVVTAPRVSQLVGQAASVEIGNLRIGIDVREAKAGA